MKRNKILVPLDFTSSSTQLLSLAELVALRWEAKLCCVHFLSETDVKAEKELINNHRGEVEIKFASLVNEVLVQSPIQFEIIVTHGQFESRLIDMVSTIGIDLIIVPATRRFSMANLLNSLIIPVLFKSEKYDSFGSFVMPVKSEKDLEAKFVFAKAFNLSLPAVKRIAMNIHKTVPRQLSQLAIMLQNEYAQLSIYPYSKTEAYDGLMVDPFFLSVYSQCNIVLLQMEFKQLNSSDFFDKLLEQVNVFLLPDI